MSLRRTDAPATAAILSGGSSGAKCGGGVSAFNESPLVLALREQNSAQSTNMSLDASVHPEQANTGGMMKGMSKALRKARKKAKKKDKKAKKKKKKKDKDKGEGDEGDSSCDSSDSSCDSDSD